MPVKKLLVSFHVIYFTGVWYLVTIILITILRHPSQSMEVTCPWVTRDARDSDTCEGITFICRLALDASWYNDILIFKDVEK